MNYLLMLMVALLNFAPLNLSPLQEETPEKKDEVKEVKLEQAAEHVGQKVAIEFEVKSSSMLKDKEICFLNSLKDHKSEKNFSVVIKGDALKLFAAEKIDDPSKHYKGKKIKVTGKIEEYKGKPQIVIEKFDQVEIVGVKPDGEQGGEDSADDADDENQNIRKFD